MPDNNPPDVLQTWQSVGSVLDERARLLADSAHAGMLDRAGLAAIDARFTDALSAALAARDACDAAADVPLVLLPDRFVVVAYQSDGNIVSTQTGRPIPPDLAIAPIAQDGSQPVATAGGLTLPAGTEWTVDYAQAEAVGMAVTLQLAGGIAKIDRLFAIGVRGSFDPERAATELEELLIGHTFSDGLDILAQSTPTNNSDPGRSPWQPRRTPVAPPTTPVGAPAAGTDAASAASVLNIDGAALAGV